MESVGTILSGLAMLILFVLILVAAYFATTLIGKKYSVRGGQGGKIKVLDRVYLGQDKTIVLVEVGEQILLLGVTQHHVEKLCEIDPEDLPNTDGEELTNIPESRFLDILKQNVKNNFGRNTASGEKGNTHDGEM